MFLYFDEFESISSALSVKKRREVETKGKSLECISDKNIVDTLVGIHMYACDMVYVLEKNGDIYLAGFFKFRCYSITRISHKIKQHNSLFRFTVGSISDAKLDALQILSRNSFKVSVSFLLHDQIV
jgi:hypothetical protein